MAGKAMETEVGGFQCLSQSPKKVNRGSLEFPLKFRVE